MSDSEVSFTWMPEYSARIGEIDAQRQEPVNILNRLFIALSKPGGGQVAGVPDALTGYTRTHFGLEENPIHFAVLAFLRTWLKEHIQGEDIK